MLENNEVGHKGTERIGVFICHCGINIASTVNIDKLSENISKYPGVVHSEDYKYMCSEPGQKLISDSIKKHKLTGVVIACCSPTLHENTFRRLSANSGLNAYMCEIANIREQCSWVHEDKTKATKKAITIVKTIIEKVRGNESLTPVEVPVTKKALVIGGGIAGIQAALDIADGGQKVILVERSPSIGGHMAQLSETFPTLDCSQCILTPKMVDIGQHPNIKLYTYSEIEEVSGYVGNFKVKIRRKAPYVDWEKCNGCGDCPQACPVNLRSEFDEGLADRKAIYRPFPQAVPNKFVIDKLGIPSCKYTCPAGVNVQGYVALISQGKYKEALALEREDNPFPAVCGRICNHPCETECKRGEFDEPIAIRSLKRFIADQEIELERAELPLEKGESVAVVGSGPAGLTCAYYLAKYGYRPTVFESSPVIGGMLSQGIPEFRLSRKELSKDIKYIIDCGVEIKTNTTISDVEKLLKDGYKAIFIATGAHLERRLGIEGEDLEGVYYGLEFLKHVNSGQRVKIGNQIAVIGGGNSAVDAARVALRLGAKEVTIVYRRSRIEMPANEEEIIEAEREGIKITYLVTPTKILGKDGKVSGMECIRMILGPPDESGRRRPIPIEGSEFTIVIDTIIPTIGQSPDISYLESSRIEKTHWNTIVVDSDTFQTNIKGVFAGGDAVSGPATVIEAISSSKEAAISIDRFIKGEDLKEGRKVELKRVEEVEIPKWLERRKREKMNTLPVDKRISNFSEVELGFTEEQARMEAERCINCGGCAECKECEKVCEPEAILYNMHDEIVDEEVGTIVVATGYGLYPVENIGEYGAGKYEDVINGLQFERLLSASGPTQGEIRRPSDNKIPKRVAFISCVGSRDAEHHLPYCSKICCMYMVKHALLYKEHVPDGEAIVFSIDVRTAGKDYEEFYNRAKEEGKILYIRGKPARILKEGNEIIIWSIDTLTGRQIRLKCDMAVLSMAIVPSTGAFNLAKQLRIQTNSHGFFTEAHPKLRPVETNTSGILLAGCAQAPRDIPDVVAQASGAAAKALDILSSDKLHHLPIIAAVNEDLCSGCRICMSICPYDAREIDEEKNIVTVKEVLCEGCGACISACPSGASQQKNFTDEQINNMIKIILE